MNPRGMAGLVARHDGGPATGDAPPVPQTLEDTGLSVAFVSDLLLKTLYVQGARRGDQLEATVRLPFRILDDELLTLQHRKLVEVRGAQGRGRRGYTFDLTGEGRTRCREILETSRYVGPAPVPLQEYTRWVRLQSARHVRIDEAAIREGLDDLVFENPLVETLGPAINSGKSLFLYGEAGNGKTSIAEAIAEMLGETVFVPFAIEVEGQIITVYDPVVHRVADGGPDEDPEVEAGGDGALFLRPPPTHDPRFLNVRRPAVFVGGELTLEELELRHDADAGAFRAPPQVKANGGVFVIDDFGRQRVRPRDLLNRWMVPLDRKVDFLSLPMGHQLPFPFECFLIFATNLDPSELVEEAFLRRIRYKIHVGDPSRSEYEEIFRRSCEARGLAYDPEAVDFVFREYYEERGIAPRGCHPRDILEHILDTARFRDTEPGLSREMLSIACRSCFLDVPAAAAHPLETDPAIASVRGRVQ